MVVVVGRITEGLLRISEIVERAFEFEVDNEYLDSLRAFVGDPISGLDAEAQKMANRGVRQIAASLSDFEKAEDKKLWKDYLDASYAELFLGVTPKAIEPAESCYLNDERVLYAEQYFQVKELMEANGFEIPKRFQEPADHLAMEWAFLLDLFRTGKMEVASEFFDNHLGVWAQSALDDIIDRDDVGFYSGIANLAKAVVFELNAN